MLQGNIKLNFKKYTIFAVVIKLKDKYEKDDYYSLFIDSYPIHKSTGLRLNPQCYRTKKVDTIKKGDKVTLLNIERISETNIADGTYGLVNPVKDKYILNYESNGVKGVCEPTKLNERFEYKIDNTNDYWSALIIDNVLDNIVKNGTQYSLRREMERDVMEYINKANSWGLVFNDPYLENYIYSLIAKIAPVEFIDGRPGNVTVLILNDESPNAGMYPNGTMVIHTGLLSALHTEDELVAILAHEIAHYVLDHAVINYIKEIKRQKNAEFWAALLTGMTAIAEGVVAANNKYYTPGAATIGVAILSSGIASAVSNRLGMKYSHEQEKQADLCARKILELTKYNPNALATALSRLKDISIRERSNTMYFASYSHPALESRIKENGTIMDKIDPDFEKKVSFAVTYSSIQKYDTGRFREALKGVKQNIANNVGTADDYTLNAACLLNLYNDAEHNQEALSLLTKAKLIDPSNLNIFKQEIIVHMRLNQYPRVIRLLDGYLEELDIAETQLEKIKSPNAWDRSSEYLASEKNWARMMIIKVKGMAS